MSVVRMLRLVRLFTFVKAVPTLRSIIGGLVVGLQSVTYIVILLFLIIYIFAIVSCMFFGRNDPARFGDIAVSMLSLYQVIPLSLQHYGIFIRFYLTSSSHCLESIHFVQFFSLWRYKISTLCNWTTIAYTSYFGCVEYYGHAYDNQTWKSRIFTLAGTFQACYIQNPLIP